MGGEERRNGEMEAVKNQSMRRKIVEERERNWEKSTWEVKPGRARVGEDCGEKAHSDRILLDFHYSSHSSVLHKFPSQNYKVLTRKP